MKYAVCTSFSRQGYRIYGKRFIETFLEHWPDDVQLYVVHEGADPTFPDSPRVIYRDLVLDRECREFAEKAAKRDPRATSKHFKWGAIKWSKKVFALAGVKTEAEWLIWIDADVETTAPITCDWLAKVLPDDKALAFLGRPTWRYSECGFVGYHLTHDPRVPELLQQMRRTYTSLHVFDLAEWGDSYVFDHCRRKLFGAKEDYYNDLSVRPNGSRAGILHVWPTSQLGGRMEHYKGPKRKTVGYGATC